MRVKVIETADGDDGNGTYTAAEMFEDVLRIWLTDGYELAGFAAAFGPRLFGVLVKREER